MNNELCYCKVSINKGMVFAYYCDVDGKNPRNFSKHLKLKSVCTKINKDGWKIICTRWPNEKQVIYTLQSVMENQDTQPTSLTK